MGTASGSLGNSVRDQVNSCAPKKLCVSSHSVRGTSERKEGKKSVVVSHNDIEPVQVISCDFYVVVTWSNGYGR